MRLQRLLSEPTDIQQVAAGQGITPHERARLAREFGSGRWRKMKGRARVELVNGWIGWAEVHRYEAHGIGRVDWKLKRTLE
jgi:hypothetical protein